MRRNLGQMRLGIWLQHISESPRSSIAIRHGLRIHSSFVPLACNWGCTVGPGAVDWPAGREGSGGGLEVGGGSTRWGYCRLAAPAVVLAALEVNEPIMMTTVLHETKGLISESLRRFQFRRSLSSCKIFARRVHPSTVNTYQLYRPLESP